MMNAPPRLYCIPATASPIVAVFRRGPSAWSHVGRWDVSTGVYEPGAWLGGRVFPRRSDLSPDGTWLCYFAHKPSADWEHGEAYVAISKLPWLTALHAFATCGTWTRGYHFTADRTVDTGAGESLPLPFGLRATRAEQFATERRRGWVEAPDSPTRASSDAWDERRNARLVKRQPGGERLLCVESLGHAFGEFQAQAVDGLNVRYSLEAGEDIAILDDLQWADWSHDGRLLVATRDGRLQVRAPERDNWRVSWEVDLAPLEPTPTPAPQWAQQW